LRHVRWVRIGRDDGRERDAQLAPAQHASWLTPQRMKVATVAIFSAAALGSSVTLGGSSTPAQHTGHNAPVSLAAHSTR
jgi:hypothetical protein